MKKKNYNWSSIIISAMIIILLSSCNNSNTKNYSDDIDSIYKDYEKVERPENGELTF